MWEPEAPLLFIAVVHVIPSVTSPHPIYSQIIRISTQREAGKIPFLYITLAVAICISHHVSQTKQFI